MMLNKTAITIILIAILLSCTNNKFKKDPSGLQYRIIAQGYGDKPQPGQWLRLQVKQYFNDSLLSDTHNYLPQYQKLDTAEMSKESYRIFSQVRTGDSLIFKLSSDSAFKKTKPAFAQRKGWLNTFVKVEAIFRSDVEAQADLELEKNKRGLSQPAPPQQTDPDQ